MNHLQDKRSVSSPSTQIKISKEPHVLQRAHSQRHQIKQQKSQQEKLSLQKMCERLIEFKNSQNVQKGIPYGWNIILIEQKRTITGIKVRLKCKFIDSMAPVVQPQQQQKNNIYVVIRLSFTLDYFKIRSISEGNIFIQLDQTNFQLQKQEKRNFQTEIQNIIKPFFAKRNYHQQEQEGRWIRQLFNGVQNILKQNNNFKNKPFIRPILLNRNQINKNYILYHPPVSFAWNPKGVFCITQTKIPANRNNFIGNPVSFKLHLQAQKFQGINKINQQQIAETINSSDNQTQSIFNWDVRQQLDLMSLSKHNKQDIQLYYADQRTDQKTKQLYAIPTMKHDAQIIVLDYLSKISPITRKIYERYFIKVQGQNTLEQFHRGDRLKVFAINDKMRRYQDEMIYLIDKINNDKLKPTLDVILSNQFISYPNILSSASCSIDNLRFHLITHFLKESSQSCKQNYSQKFKFKERNSQINNLNFMVCLKSIIVQNENFAVQLQNYFKNSYKILGVQSKNFYYIGSYFHFDEYKAQKVLMDLMRMYLQNIISHQQKQADQQIVVRSSINQRFKQLIKIKTLKKLSAFSVQLILSEDQRKKFIQIVLPILLVRDRSSNSSQFRQIQRILATNSKLIKFCRQLNELVIKLDNKKYQFIENLINKEIQSPVVNYEDVLWCIVKYVLKLTKHLNLSKVINL